MKYRKSIPMDVEENLETKIVREIWEQERRKTVKRAKK